MRILSITNQISFPSSEINFQQSWYYLFISEQIKRSNKNSIICDRHLKFEYLPERVSAQFLLFNPQVVIVQLEWKYEKLEFIVETLVGFKNKLTEGIRVVLLPTQDERVNKFLMNDDSIATFYNREKFEQLTKELKFKHSVDDHQKIFEYLNLVI